MVFSGSSSQALKQFQAHPFDVVVTDVKMPQINGIDLVLAMRQIHKKSSFILLTGTADLPLALDAINRAEIFRFFTKPCAAAMLIEAISAALQAQAADRSSSELGAELLDSFAAGLLVVDAAAKVQFMNQQAREMGAACDGIAVGKDQILRTSSVAQTAQLHDLIQLAARGQAGGSMAIHCPKSERTMAAVIVSPTPSHNPATVAVYLRFPDDWHITSTEQLATIFSLTPA